MSDQEQINRDIAGRLNALQNALVSILLGNAVRTADPMKTIDDTRAVLLSFNNDTAEYRAAVDQIIGVMKRSYERTRKKLS